MSGAQGQRARLSDFAHYLSLLVVCAWFAAMSVRAIANVWQWGHNGYNGAAFWQAARNSLRFGVVGQALYHMELGPPSASQVYTHHPLLLHAHLVVTQWLFGTAEWAARLVPAFYSALTPVVLYLVVRQLWDRSVALATSAVYVVLPLPLIFANMVDHEQASVIWIVLLVFAVVRWYEAPSRRWLALALVTFTLAAQWDWAAYYVAAFVALVGVARLARGPRPWIAWGPEQRFLVIFSTVVLLNFFGFFAWIAWMRGDVGNMHRAFGHRTGAVDGYWASVGARFLDLYGPLPLVLFAAWLAWCATRPLRLRTLLPVSFAGVQLLHSVIFKQAGHLHSYWIWYAAPALAIGAAELAVNALRAPALLGRRVAAIGLAGAFAWQCYFAWRQWSWGFATGSASYAVTANQDDYVEELRWARELGHAFERQRNRYLAHSSVARRRIEFDWYLDAPVQDTASISVPPADGARDVVLLLDLHYLPMTPATRRALAALTQSADVTVWARRFVAAKRGPARLRAFEAVERPASVAWRWLVHPGRPPIEWVEGDVSAASALLSAYEDVVPTQAAGGMGGVPFEWLCPAGEAVAGLRGWSSLEPVLLAGFEVQCTGGAEATQGPWWGARAQASAGHASCSAGASAVGLRVRAGSLVDAVGLSCAVGDEEVPTGLIGGTGGAERTLRCPPGLVLVGVAGRSGERIDQLAGRCAALALAPQPEDAPPKP